MNPVINTQTINAVSWTPIIAKLDCDNFRILNLSGQLLKVRSDANDAATELNTEDMQEVPIDAFICKNTPSPRFKKDTVVLYGQLDLGSGDVKTISQ